MGLILNIETATQVCSVNIARDGILLSIRSSNESKSHASRLTLFIEEMLNELELNINDLDAIAVSKGPGSYTGLRIGVSTAKGLCYASGLPLIGISTLQSLANTAVDLIKDNHNPSGEFFLYPMIDARRMEIYSAMYDKDGHQVREIRAEIVDETFSTGLEHNHRIYFFGDGATKCSSFLRKAGMELIPDVALTSVGMLRLSEDAFLKNQFEDTAYFEPYYLKDFIASFSTKKIF
jgi:tRNA threonylcarbamoyladenosine biosynthesis protein TsaB